MLKVGRSALLVAVLLGAACAKPPPATNASRPEAPATPSAAPAATQTAVAAEPQPKAPEPAPAPAVVQLYQGELNGEVVWLELGTSANGFRGELQTQDRFAAGNVDVRSATPPDDSGEPPTNHRALECEVTLASLPLRPLAFLTSQSLKASCIFSERLADMPRNGFPELIVADGVDPASSTTTKLWVRALAKAAAERLDPWLSPLLGAQKPARAGCARSLRVDQVEPGPAGQSYVAYWSWDFCPNELLAFAREAEPRRQKNPWHEQAALALVSEAHGVVARSELGKPSADSEQLTIQSLGSYRGQAKILRIERRYEFNGPTFTSSSVQKYLYASSARFPLRLALGPLRGQASSGNCWGTDTEVHIVEGGGMVAMPDEFLVRTVTTRRYFRSGSCDSSDRASIRPYRFDLTTATYKPFWHPGIRELTEQESPL